MIKKLTNKLEGACATHILDTLDGIDLFYNTLDDTETRVTDELVTFIEQLEEETGVVAVSIFEEVICIENALNEDGELKHFENDVICVQENALEDFKIEELKKNNKIVVLFKDEECEEIPFTDECDCCICEEIEEAFENGFDRAIELIESEKIETPEWILDNEEYTESEIYFHSMANGFKILTQAGVPVDDAVFKAYAIVSEIMNK